MAVVEALADKRAGLSREAVLKGSRLTDGGGVHNSSLKYNQILSNIIILYRFAIFDTI